MSRQPSASKGASAGLSGVSFRSGGVIAAAFGAEMVGAGHRGFAIRIVHMGANADNGEAAHDADIDAAIVISVDHHYMFVMHIVLGAQYLFVEAFEARQAGENSLGEALQSRRQALDAALAAQLAQINALASSARVQLDMHALWAFD